MFSSTQVTPRKVRRVEAVGMSNTNIYEITPVMNWNYDCLHIFELLLPFPGLELPNGKYNNVVEKTNALYAKLSQK